MKNIFLIFALVSLCFGGLILEDANKSYNNGKIQEAIRLYRKAALNGENPALCYFNLGNAYFQIDSIPQSIVYYKACTGYAPDFFRAWLNLAIAYHTLNDAGACIATAKRALMLKDGHQKTLFLLAASYKKTNAYPEAIATFEKMVQLYPENDEPYIALAEMYRELDDNEEAVKWLKKYPEAGKNESYVYIMLSDICKEMNDQDKALYYLQKSYEVDNSNKWVLYRIVNMHSKMGNRLLALKRAISELEKIPDFSELALLAGNIAFNLEKYNVSERYYQLARSHGNAGAVIGLENIRVIRNQQRQSSF